MLPSDDEAMILVAYGDVLRAPLLTARLEGRADRLRTLLAGTLLPAASEKADLASRIERAKGLSATQKEVLKMSLFDLMIELTRLEHAHQAENEERDA